MSIMSVSGVRVIDAVMAYLPQFDGGRLSCAVVVVVVVWAAVAVGRCRVRSGGQVSAVLIWLAGDCGGVAGLAFWRCRAMAATTDAARTMAASPTAPPSCAALDSSPEASPATVSWTWASAAVLTETNENPPPNPIRTRAGRMLA